MEEPSITINGTPLTTGQAMTLRVALSSFFMEMQESGLGDDEHGKFMKEAYLRCSREIFSMMKRT